MDNTIDYRLFKLSVYDVLLIIFIGTFSVWCFLTLRKPPSDGKQAIIYHDGHVIQHVDLRSSGKKELHLKHGTMVLEIAEGRIRVLESSCPHKLCVKAGWTKKNGLPIVCVPNRILIEVKGNDVAYDAVSQ